jgi:hypothetical protein
MAKVTVIFEDIDEGVSVKVESEPGFPGPAASPEEKNSLTDAQQMGLRMTHLLTEEMASQEGHDHDHDHDHDHNDHHAEVPSDGTTAVQSNE